MIVIYLIVITVSALYLYFKLLFTHWRQRGFPYIEPKVPFGNLELVATRKSSFGVNLYQLYKATTEPIVGIYLFFRPALLIRDVTLIKRVLVTDFEYFHDRGVCYNPKNDPLSAHLFSMPGHQWKVLRKKLTPIFTSGKLKEMLPAIITIGEHLQGFLKPFADKGAVVDIKDILNR